MPDEAQIVYKENGVTIKAFPVPHGIYGAVGYRLDYAGLSIVYAGDCELSTITVEKAQHVDLLIHEIFNPPATYVEKMGWTEVHAKIVAWTKHTSPEAAAKVFMQTSPGMAMGLHAMVARGTPQPILDGLRTEYVKRMGGVNPDPSLMHGLPSWLEDTVIPWASTMGSDTERLAMAVIGLAKYLGSHDSDPGS